MLINVLQTGPIATNTYLLDCGQFLTVIDPGEDAGRILTAAEKIGKPISAILLTHAHWDHIGAAAQIQKTGAKIVLHKTDADILPYAFRRGIPEFSPDIFCADGEILKLGNRDFFVIHTPGHTAGSVCFQTGNDLFTGDTLFCGDVGRCDLPTGDFEKMKSSLKRLFAIDADLKVLPGHGVASSLKTEKEFCRYV